tara:strand:+ start:52 stop:960 length:909 start_codon:yes stop_codon:yes gene_type:complete
MYKLLVAFSIILVIFFQNPIISLILGLIIGLILDDKLKNYIKPIGSLPLQIGIVLIGFSISFRIFKDLLINYFPILSLFVILTFITGLLLGRLFNIDKKFIYLISSATAICGATAALVISSIIKAKPNQVSLAIFIIFIMNAIALAIFPIVGKYLGLSDLQFGLFSALAIHDTGSVVGSGLLFSDDAGEIAATLKVGRTIWILPLIVVVTNLTNKERTLSFNDLPKFIILFFIAIIISNTFNLPAHIIDISKILSFIFINIGIFLIGVQSKIEKISHLSNLMYPIFFWIIVVTISFVVVTGL